MSLLILCALLLPALPPLAPAHTLAAAPPTPLKRLSDQEVKRLMESAVHGVERVAGALPALHRPVSLEAPAAGEASLSSLLDELERRGGKMLVRFDKRYPANSEVLSFLRLGSVVDRRAAELPARARSEWEEARFELTGLANAYGLSWTGEPADWRAFRMTDADVERAILSLTRGAKALELELEPALAQTRHLSPASRRRLLEHASQLHETAKKSRERFARGGDLENELRRMSSWAREIEAFVDQHLASIQLQSMWQAVEWDLEVLHDAFAQRHR